MQLSKQAKHVEPSSGTAPAVAMKGSREASKACAPGCCSGRQAQDVSFLVPLAEALAPQNTLKRGTAAEASSRNVSQRSVRFSLDLQEVIRSPVATNNNSATPGASCLKNSGAQPAHKYTIVTALETAPSTESAFSMASVRLRTLKALRPHLSRIFLYLEIRRRCCESTVLEERALLACLNLP